MDKKLAKKFNSKVLKDTRTKLSKPGDLLSSKSKRGPTKKTLSIMGLV